MDMNPKGDRTHNIYPYLMQEWDEELPLLNNLESMLDIEFPSKTNIAREVINNLKMANFYYTQFSVVEKYLLGA